MGRGDLLPKLLDNLHEKIVRELGSAHVHRHPVSRGDASELVWRKLLKNYLPRRYKVARGQVIDSCGELSGQIDVIVFDRQYTPLVFEHEGQVFIPAESVYAVFEVKQTINAAHVRAALKKVESVRRLHRTSLPIPHAGGTYPPKRLVRIYGGILTLESGWKTSLSASPLSKHLSDASDSSFLELGCVAKGGYFYSDEGGKYKIYDSKKAVTIFLFKLIALLQSSGTVPMIDTEKYVQWLGE